MKENPLTRLLAFAFCFFFFLSCASLSKPVPLHSKDLIYNIKWTLLSSKGERTHSFFSLIFLREDQLLRMDLNKALIGSVFRLILRDKRMLLQEPLKRRYYVGEFSSQIFFPDFPSFSMEYLIAILRGQALKPGSCQTEKKRIIFCQTGPFQVFWEYKNQALHRIHIKAKGQRQIQAELKKLSQGKFSKKIFFPALKGWLREKDPLFFQKL